MDELNNIIGRMTALNCKRAIAVEGAPSKLMGKSGEETGPTLSKAEMDGIIERNLSIDLRGALDRTGKSYFRHDSTLGRFDVYIAREGGVATLKVETIGKPRGATFKPGTRLIGLMIVVLGLAWTGMIFWFAFKTGRFYRVLVAPGPMVTFMGLPALILGQKFSSGPDDMRELTPFQHVCLGLGLLCGVGSVWWLGGGQW